MWGVRDSLLIKIRLVNSVRSNSIQRRVSQLIWQTNNFLGVIASCFNSHKLHFLSFHLFIYLCYPTQLGVRQVSIYVDLDLGFNYGGHILITFYLYVFKTRLIYYIKPFVVYVTILLLLSLNNLVPLASKCWWDWYDNLSHQHCQARGPGYSPNGINLNQFIIRCNCYAILLFIRWQMILRAYWHNLYLHIIDYYYYIITNWLINWSVQGSLYVEGILFFCANV